MHFVSLVSLLTCVPRQRVFFCHFCLFLKGEKSCVCDWTVSNHFRVCECFFFKGGDRGVLFIVPRGLFVLVNGRSVCRPFRVHNMATQGPCLQLVHHHSSYTPSLHGSLVPGQGRHSRLQ